jgi:uncharacterized small protein (DUF1192 family)
VAENESNVWLDLASDAYTTSTTYLDAYLRPEWERAIRQWQGKHAVGSKYLSDAWQKRSCVFRPKTRAAVRKNEAAAAAAFFSTQDVVEIKPVDDSDPINLMAGEIMQGMVNFRLTKTIPWFLTLIGAYQEAQKVGVCASYQYWEYDEGKADKPCIELIPPENLRIDPGANWIDPINTSPYLIHLIPMYLGDVLERMRTPDPKTNEPKWFPLTAAELMSASGERNDSTRMVRDGNRADPKEQSNSAFSEFNIVWIRRNIILKDGVDWLFYTAGGEHMLSNPVPRQTVYHHGIRPYAMGACVLEAFKVYPDGIVSLTRDIQDELNEVTNQRLDNIKFVLNKRYFVKRGAQVDMRSLSRNTPGSSTMMNDPEKDVKESNWPDVTSSSFQEQDRLNLDFDDLAGTFSQSTVQANRSLNETVGGMTLISDGANQVSEYQLRMFSETWVEPVLRQLVALEQAYETDPIVLKFAGQNSQLFKAYNMAQIPDQLLSVDMNVSVNVGIGSTNPETQIRRFFYGMESLAKVVGPDQFAQKLDFEEVVKEAFGKLGYKDGKRFFNLDEEDPRIAELKTEIERLQQQLMMKRSPEVDAATAEKIRAEAVNSRVDAALKAMQAGQTIATIPAVAPVGDEILASAGFEDMNGPPVATPPELGYSPPPRESRVRYIRENPIIEEGGEL